MAEQSTKRKQGQTLLTNFISKKQMTSPLETTASVLENLGNVLQIAENGEKLGDANSASPIEVIELEIPDTQNMYELPDQMPKMNTSNYKMNSSWFGEFSWLKLAEDRKSLYCMTCFWALKDKRFNHADTRTYEGGNNMLWINREAGWADFKKGRDGILKHDGSGIHKRGEYALNAVKLAHIHRVILDERVANDYEQNRIGLEAVFEVVRVCGHQGLALRGHRDEDNTANFNCLFKLIGKFNTSVQNYITADNKFKYLTPQSQNEFLEIFAHGLQRHLITRINSESVGRTRAEEQPIYSIILDETSDINRKEQVSFCIRFCNAHMESEEVFLGFHNNK